jgi:hypothetical protein
VALVALAFCAVNPALVSSAGLLLSEVPFLLLTTLALWATARDPRDAPAGSTDERRSARLAAIAIVAAVFAPLVRTIGVTLLAALFVHWLMEKRYRRAAILMAAAAAIPGSWILWTVFAPRAAVGRTYVDHVGLSAGQQAGPVRIVVERLGRNIPGYLANDLPPIIGQPVVPGTAFDNAAGLLVVLALAIAGSWILWRQARPVAMYIALYAGLIALWTWQIQRYLIPLVPFFFWLVVAGGFVLAARRRWYRLAIAGIAAIMLSSATFQSVKGVAHAVQCGRSTETNPSCFQRSIGGLLVAARYVRQSTPDTAVVFTFKDAVVGYLSARRAVLPHDIDVRDPADFLPELRARSVDYALLTPLITSEGQSIPALIARCHELAVERVFQGNVLLLRVLPPGAVPAANGCAALEHLSRIAEQG